MRSFITLGKKIYNMENPREVRRMVIFVVRSMMHRARMRQLLTFFRQNSLLKSVAATYPFVYEQPTRAFFYRGSTFAERARIVEQHMTFMAENFQANVVCGLYPYTEYILWQSEFEGKPLCLELFHEPGQRKEGLLSVTLRWSPWPLYQIVFWIAKNEQDEWSMWIGAMQGPNIENAKDVIKRITKQCHAYRTKNLILYAAQAVARALQLRHIYAVTNYGYYANNHVRTDRKLRTSFSNFWQEAGGHATSDQRFDELPLVEPRKTIDEVPTRKRAVYRKRFALLDEIDAAIANHMEKLCK
jgi:uncharacterized protein